jgi:hypothetical protein
MKEKAGAFLAVVGIIFLAAFAIAATRYRFQNDHLTETQLTIWAFRWWWMWVPAAVVSLAGIWMVRK